MARNLVMLFSVTLITFLHINNTNGAFNFENNSAKGANRVVSVAGNRAEIPCISNPRKKGDKPTLILWYKESFNKPIYSYDARSTSLTDGERWANDTLFGERAYFVPLSKPHALLIVEPIKASDEGEYVCRLDYEDSPTTSSTVNVTVVVYPSPPEIYWSNQLVNGPIGPMQEGTYWRLVCITRGGKPSPIVTWWREGYQVRSEVQKTEKEETKAILTVIAARNLSMNTFSCHAQVLYEGSPVGQPLVASIIFRIILPPIAISITGGDKPVAVDTTLSLRCTTWGSYPPAEVIWWKSGKKIKPFVQSISEGGNSSTSETKLTVKEADHGSTFTCVASNPKYNVPSLEKSITLNVMYKPVVTLRAKVASEFVSKTANWSSHERSVVVKKGAHIRLECPIHANPPPDYIEWIQNGITIDSGKTAFSFLLENAVRENSGIYTCSATNDGGVGVSLPFMIAVEYAPLCVKGWLKRTYGSEMNRPVTILCRVDALPADDLTFWWSKIYNSNEEILFNADQIQTDGVTSRLTVTLQNRSDYGQLLCRAKNSAGMQVEPCQVTLVPSSRPDPPFNCSTEYGGVPGSLLVSCLEGFNGGFPQKFTLIAVQKGRLISNITRDFSDWMILNLETGKSVTLRIESVNSRGKSEIVRLEAFVPVPQIMSDQDVNQLEDGSFRNPKIELPVIGILVGGGGVLLVSLLVVLVYVMVTRNQEKQKAFLKSKKRSSIKKTNSVTSNCSLPNNGYDVLSLNRMKKHSDPDVVICIKKEQSRRSPSKGIDIVPQAQLESLNANINDSSNLEVVDSNSAISVHGSISCDDLAVHASFGSENHLGDYGNQNAENNDVEKETIVPKIHHKRLRSIQKNRSCEGDYSELPTTSSVPEKKTAGIYNKFLERRSSAPIVNEVDTNDFNRGLIQQKRCRDCDECCHCRQNQCYLNQNQKNSFHSLEPSSIPRNLFESQGRPYSHKQSSLHKSVSIDEVNKRNGATIPCNSLRHSSNRCKNSYTEGHRTSIYEEASNFLPQKANLKGKAVTTSAKKSNIWSRSFGSLFCASKNKSNSLKGVETAKTDLTKADQSSTYQKFDGVCSYEFSSTYSMDKLEKVTPKESRENKLQAKKMKNSTERKSEFEDLLYISKAELDILLNIDDNKNEQKFLEDVSPLKELLQQKRGEKTINRNSKNKNYSNVNDISKSRGSRDKKLKSKTKRDHLNKREFKTSSSPQQNWTNIKPLECFDSTFQKLEMANPIDFPLPATELKPSASSESQENLAGLQNSKLQNSPSKNGSFSKISEPEEDRKPQCSLSFDNSMSDLSRLSNTKAEILKETDNPQMENVKLRAPKIPNSKMKRINLDPEVLESGFDLNDDRKKTNRSEPQLEKKISGQISVNSALKEDSITQDLPPTPFSDNEIDSLQNKQPLKSILRHN